MSGNCGRNLGTAGSGTPNIPRIHRFKRQTIQIGFPAITNSPSEKERSSQEIWDCMIEMPSGSPEMRDYTSERSNYTTEL